MACRTPGTDGLARSRAVVGAVAACLLACLAATHCAAGAKAGNRNEAQIRLARQGWAQAAKEGWLEGIRQVDLLRADLLSVTLDPGIVGALDTKPFVCRAMGGPQDYQKPDAFSITSPTDPRYKQPVHPTDVGRTTYEGRNSMDAKKLWALFVNIIHWHDYFLALPHPLQSGHTYTLRVETSKERDPRFKYEWKLPYDERKTATKAIKINQVAYSAMARRRYAYLGWWAGDKGKVDYAALESFEAIDEKTGKPVLNGPITLREAGDTNSGEDVYQMDISKLPPGRYHIHILGFARSETLRIGGAGIHELYYHTMRAFFHQRCGQELGPPHTWVRKPACHTEIWESGHFVAGPGAIHHSPGNRFQHANYEPEPGEARRSFKGGYHDAADFDTFTYHLPATEQILTAWELHPGAFADGDLDLPESGNGIPDLIDEAEWGLSFYIDNQYPNGAVPLGRGNLCDAFRQNIAAGKQAPIPPFGILPPARESTPTFAAVAARFARVIRKHDPAKAARYLAAARKAFDYAKTHDPKAICEAFSTEDIKLLPHEKRRHFWIPTLTWAAAELLLATGEAAYNDFITRHRRDVFHWVRQAQRWWPYLMCDANVADPELQAEMRRRLIEAADKKVASTEEAAYRMGNGKGRACGWGACQGANHGDLLLRAYTLTRDHKYLDAACHNADWHLGANPLSKTLITHMGTRHPRRPEISWFLYEEPDRDMSGCTVKGISIYGIGPPLKSYPGQWPLWRSWRDVWDRFAEIYSEFTVPQTCGPAAILYATLYGLEKDAGLIPKDSKPDPLAR